MYTFRNIPVQGPKNEAVKAQWFEIMGLKRMPKNLLEFGNQGAAKDIESDSSLTEPVPTTLVYPIGPVEISNIFNTEFNMRAMMLSKKSNLCLNKAEAIVMARYIELGLKNNHAGIACDFMQDGSPQQIINLIEANYKFFDQDIIKALDPELLQRQEEQRARMAQSVNRMNNKFSSSGKSDTAANETAAYPNEANNSISSLGTLRQRGKNTSKVDDKGQPKKEGPSKMDTVINEMQKIKEYIHVQETPSPKTGADKDSKPGRTMDDLIQHQKETIEKTKESLADVFDSSSLKYAQRVEGKEEPDEQAKCLQRINQFFSTVKMSPDILQDKSFHDVFEALYINHDPNSKFALAKGFYKSSRNFVLMNNNNVFIWLKSGNSLIYRGSQMLVKDIMEAEAKERYETMQRLMQNQQMMNQTQQQPVVSAPVPVVVPEQVQQVQQPVPMPQQTVMNPPIITVPISPAPAPVAQPSIDMVRREEPPVQQPTQQVQQTQQNPFQPVQAPISNPFHRVDEPVPTVG